MANAKVVVNRLESSAYKLDQWPHCAFRAWKTWKTAILPLKIYSSNPFFLFISQGMRALTDMDVSLVFSKILKTRLNII